MPILILIMKSGASRFITNQGEFLRDLLNSYIPSSKTVDCLTGYFYFSGFLGVYKAIGERQMRVLVGMDADVDVHNCLRETLPVDTNRNRAPLSKLNIRNAWQEGLRDVINKADVGSFREEFGARRTNHGSKRVGIDSWKEKRYSLITEGKR